MNAQQNVMVITVMADSFLCLNYFLIAENLNYRCRSFPMKKPGGRTTES